MPTEENQTQVNLSNSDGSNQSNTGNPAWVKSDDWSANPNISWENQKVDNLDIDLNLDWLDLPIEEEKKAEVKKDIVDNSWEDKLDNLDLDLGDINDSEDKKELEENNKGDLIKEEWPKEDVSIEEIPKEDVSKEENNLDVENIEVLDNSQNNKQIEEDKKDEKFDIDLDVENKNNSEQKIDNLNLDNLNVEKISENDNQIDFSSVDSPILNPIDEQPKEDNINWESNLVDENVIQKEDTFKDDVKTENVQKDNMIGQDDKDWLLNEDKKVEETLQGWVDKNININNDSDENNPDKIKENRDEILKSDDNVENLNIPFVQKEDNNIEKVDKKIEEKNLDLPVKNDVNLLDESWDEKQNQNPDLPKNYNQNEFQLEDLWEKVVENKDWDMVSDTWNVVESKNWYIPNENDFQKVTDVLNSDTKWEIDLWSLDKTVSDSQNLDLWDSAQNIWNNDFSNWMDLDSIISWVDNVQNNSNIIKNNEEVIETNQLVENKNTNINNSLVDNEVVNKNQTSDNVNNINDFSGIEQNNTQQNNLTDNVAPAIENDINLNQTNQTNQNQNQNNVSYSAPIKNKKLYSGIKIFVLIVLLIVWWFMIFSKMYPEEIKDIISTIKNGSETSIEYSDNSDMWVVLNETWSNLSGDVDVLEEDENIEDDYIDPDSLAGQLNNDLLTWSSLTWDISINDDFWNISWDVLMDDQDWQHNSADFDAFEELDDLMDSANSGDNLLERLNWYLEVGNDFNNWGRENNNSTAMKYWLYIANYAQQFIEDIESGKEIDKFNIDEYITRFDSYINKLNNLRDSLEEVDSNLWDTDIIPDDTTQISTWTGF